MKKLQILLIFILFSVFSFSQSNLVAYYPFNGNVNDESENANNGTVNGATLTTDRFGNANSAYYFDGSSNYISITDSPDINIQTGESFTISYWIKHAAQNNGKYMISKYLGSIGVEPSYALGTGSNGDSYSWFEFTAGNGIENRGSIDLNDANWHNITTVFKSGESISIYIDGVLDVTKSTTYAESIINTNDLTIGCNADLTRFYNGSIDDIKIYKKVLSEIEIKNEVNGLVAYYPFNGNANDESGSENNGTVNGATLTTDRNENPNSAYYFDGVNDFIECLFPGPLEATSRTISFWAKTNVTPTSDYDNVVFSYGIITTSSDYGARFDIELNSKEYGLGCGLGGGEITKTFDNSDGNWHFYTVVFDNSIGPNLTDVLFYADGNLLTTTSAFNGTDPTIHTSDEYPIHIGMLYGYGRYFEGSIDEVKVYNKALTSTEVQNTANELIAYYPFNGNANDESENANHGSVNGASLTTDRFGNLESAYEFNGIDNFVQVANSSSLDITTNELTINMWLYNDNPDSSNLWKGISKGGYDVGNGYELIFTNDPSNINGRLSLNIGGGGYFTSSFNSYNNQWIMITGTFNSGVGKIYINGIEQSKTQQGTTNLISSTSDLFIGRRNPVNNYAGFVKGKIDDVRIYSTELSATQILNLFNNNALIVEEYNTATKNKFYINNNVLYFKNTQNLNELKNIEVYNLFGQKVFETSIIETQISFSTLQNGVYFLIVKNKEDQYSILKFIIM